MQKGYAEKDNAFYIYDFLSLSLGDRIRILDRNWILSWMDWDSQSKLKLDASALVCSEKYAFAVFHQ